MWPHQSCFASTYMTATGIVDAEKARSVCALQIWRTSDIYIVRLQADAGIHHRWAEFGKGARTGDHDMRLPDHCIHGLLITGITNEKGNILRIAGACSASAVPHLC